MLVGGQAFEWSQGKRGEKKAVLQADVPGHLLVCSNVGCRYHHHQRLTRLRKYVASDVQLQKPFEVCSLGTTMASRHTQANGRCVCSAWSRAHWRQPVCCLNFVLVWHIRNVMRAAFGEGRVKQPHQPHLTPVIQPCDRFLRGHTPALPGGRPT